MIWPLVVSGIAFLIFASGPVVARGSGARKMGALRVSVIGAFLGLLASILAGVMLAISRDWLCGIAILIGLIPLAFILPPIATVRLQKLPRINDVATDLVDPPVFAHAASMPENAGRNLEFPEKNRELVRKGYPDLAPLALQGSPDEIFDRARRAAQTMPGWAIAAADPGKRTIEASFESSVFGFVDDIIVRVRAGTSGSVIDVRSKSREGIGDFGANAARIRAYIARVKNPI